MIQKSQNDTVVTVLTTQVSNSKQSIFEHIEKTLNFSQDKSKHLIQIWDYP